MVISTIHYSANNYLTFLILSQVILKTTLGEIEIELWSKECPKACRNFVQLSLEGYYNGTIFHRVIPNFIAQGGDPTGIHIEQHIM